ncbi:MAG: mycothiol-dependent nitroreductase Rv2466c family protein [Candidatus Dormibacteria bacterium]
MKVTCFYDYTCPYSWRAYRWLSAAQRAGADVVVEWRTFSLKEANRDPAAISPFDDLGIASTSVLALALAHAARRVDFPRYHHAVFAGMHEDDRHLGEDDLLTVAGAAGVDVAAFNRERPAWLAAVAAEHRDARDRHGVFGTPTLVVGTGATAYVKLAEVPEGERAGELWRALCTLATCYPELLEIKRPVP